MLPLEKYKKTHIKVIILVLTWDEELELPNYLFIFLYLRLFWIYYQRIRNILQITHQSKYMFRNLKQELNLKLNKWGYYLEFLTSETSKSLINEKNGQLKIPTMKLYLS